MKLSLKEDINSLSYFKTNFSSIIKQLEKNNRPMIITQNGRSSGVFLDINTWEGLLKKIQLLKMVNEGERSLTENGARAIDQVEDYFKQKYDF